MAQLLNLNDHIRADCAGNVHAAAEHITLTDAVVLGGAFGDAQVVNLVFNVEAVQGGGLLRRVVGDGRDHAGTARVTADVPVSGLVGTGGTADGASPAGAFRFASDKDVVRPLNNPAVARVGACGAADEHVAFTLHDPACAGVAGGGLVEGVLVAGAVVAVAGAVLELSLRRVHLDTGVGAAAEIRLGNVDTAQLVVCRAGVLSFIGAAGVAGGFAEQQALVEGAADGHVVNFHALVIQTEYGDADGGVPDFHAGDNGHDVRFVEHVAGQVGVEDDAGDVIQRGSVRIERVATDGGICGISADVQVAYAHTHGLVGVVVAVDGGGVAADVEHAGVFGVAVGGGGDGAVGVRDDDG